MDIMERNDTTAFNQERIELEERSLWAAFFSIFHYLAGCLGDNGFFAEDDVWIQMYMQRCSGGKLCSR